MTAAKASGKALIQRVIKDMADRGLQPDAKETELLHVAAGLADQLVALRLDVKRNGTSTKLSSGRVVLNPSVQAITSTSAELSKILNLVQMELGQPKNAAKQRAARARWAAHNEAKARMQGGQ